MLELRMTHPHIVYSVLIQLLSCGVLLAVACGGGSSKAALP